MHRYRRWSLGLAVAAPLALAALGTPVMLAACIPNVVPAPSTLPNCGGLDAGCGDGGDSCCASDAVPGGDYNRVNDAGVPARVDTFVLDRYEVTVGRFRAFYSGYPLFKPQPGAGASPALGPSSGWSADWDSALPVNQGHLQSQLVSLDFPLWTDAPGPNERKPINGVTWYVAFAFCAWDGGRLPTEAEWNYAAAGGDEQLTYPWGSAVPDATLAVFGCSGANGCTIPDVGSTPAGQGRWKHQDLAGSMAEWTLDAFGLLPVNCADTCALLPAPSAALPNGRDLRGGDFTHGPEQLSTTFRVGSDPATPQDYIGFRCARDP